MSITINKTGQSSSLNITGEIEKEQLTEIATLIENPHLTNTEVSLYDASFLPTNLLKPLYDAYQKKRITQIFVYNPSLVTYLHHLDFPFLYRPPLSVTSSPSSNIKALALCGTTSQIDKLCSIIEGLPDGNISIFVALQVPKDQLNLLDAILQIKTNYSLVLPHHMIPIEPKTIYISPPSFNMKVHKGFLYLTQDQSKDPARPSIEALYTSLAREYGDHLIAAYLDDQLLNDDHSIQLINDVGGLAIIVDSAEEETSGKEKILKLSLKETASFLGAASDPTTEPSLPLLKTFFEAVEERYGYAFQSYTTGTLSRRVSQHMSQLKLDSFYDFQKLILTKYSYFEKLFTDLCIGVTDFFRHPQQLAFLRAEVLPFLKSFPHLKIWIAGCSSGETAYSLAILLHEEGLLDQTQIYATDINPSFLNQAKNGLYGIKKWEKYEENYNMSGGKADIKDYFKNYGSFVEVANFLKKKILFYQHSLAADGVFNEFQLIICSNVLIYFNKNLQKKVARLFSKSLHKDGLFMLGAKENLNSGVGEDYFCEDNISMRIYRLNQ